MIIWQGFGFLAVLIPVLIAVLFEKLFDARYGMGYSDHHHYVWGLSMIFSAAIVWFIGDKLTKPGQKVVDVQTGESLTIRKKHSLFYISMQYCAALLLLGGIVRLFI